MNISRFYKNNIEKLEVAIEFITPTFLGGADQQAELRSPPFKNLLRQWWRVVNGNLSVEDLRRREGVLFGTVLGDNECSASKVRVAALCGSPFTLSNQPFDIGATSHPEVNGGMPPVKNSIYLGFGAITPIRGTRNLSFKQYIAPGSIAILQISYPNEYRTEIIKTLQFIDAFGTIGSRSRNGYGSLSLTAEGLERLNPAEIESVPLQSLVNNAGKEYPNSFGRDSDLLLWESESLEAWTNAMTLLAETYLRTRTNINIAGNPTELHERHALAYPIMRHNVHSWDGGSGRMPSQLRLMVKRNQENRLVARILHLPHKLPKKPWPNTLPSQQQVWQQVHQFLDTQHQFHRNGGGA